MADRIKELRCFLAVHRFGNFTRGAEAVGLSQPSLSAIVASLEEDLGLQLFDRTTRSVELTAAGAELLPRALQIVNDLDDAFDSMRQTTRLARGRVRIAALPSVSSGLLPRALAEFARGHPNVEVGFLEVLAAAMPDLVASGDCDFGLGVAAAGRPDLDFTPIYDDGIVTICRDDHPFSQLDEVAWAALSDEDIIAMGNLTSVHAILTSISAETKLQLKVRYETLYMATAFGLIRQGLGISIMPRSLMSDFDTRGLVAIPLTDPSVTRRIGVVSRKGRVLSPAASRMVEIVTSKAREDPGRFDMARPDE